MFIKITTKEHMLLKTLHEIIRDIFQKVMIVGISEFNIYNLCRKNRIQQLMRKKY